MEIVLGIFKCPSCGTNLRAVECLPSATQVVVRTCRGCGDRWQLVVAMLGDRGGVRYDKAELTFRDSRRGRAEAAHAAHAAHAAADPHCTCNDCMTDVQRAGEER